MHFLLFVGEYNTLAPFEISSLGLSATQILPSVYSVISDDRDSVLAIVSRLGSSIKLAEEISASSAKELNKFVTSKNFSVTDIRNPRNSETLCEDLKQSLGSKGRFVVPKEISGLAPLLIQKHKTDEFFIDTETNIVYKTLWVMDFRDWVKKDRFLPHANARAGMLPPKIARSLVNLVPFVDTKDKVLADPFCGSGRILIEAAQLGYDVVGADISEKQATETKENLSVLNLDATIHIADAVRFSAVSPELDAIVTEPFLGKVNPRPDETPYISIGLKKLYLGALKDWTKVLKSGGYVVMVFPIFNSSKGQIKTSVVIDDKLSLSYNQLARNIVYSRPGADVVREIVILQKK